LAVGGLGVCVECGDAALAAALRQRYRLFAADERAVAGAPHLALRVQLCGRLRARALLDTATTFSAGVIKFGAPGYSGLIDAARGKGQLALSSAQPVEDLDYLVRVACAALAFQAGGLLFHAAGIVRAGRGYCFFGYSGSGKTTVARLSPHDVVLNDDLVLLMPGEGGWTVHATPFWNPSQVSPAGASSAPLAGLYRLVQDRQVYAEALGRAQALAEVIASTPVISADPARGLDLLERARRLIGQTPTFKLHFTPDPSFWPVVERAPGPG
jgi:hypothetical protein